ncbi:MAG: CBS domain-containing protein [Chloroflexota bacterium]|nr:CBS domain-containing protein [Dehalococcoidia bacterium]MDW8253255.1 CBS domain-containing protein [Chloroflexota bacterium]
MKVEELMDRQPLTARPETPVRELARRMYETRRSSVPIVDEAGHVVGIVTMTDLVARNANLHFPRYIQLLDSIIYLESTKEYEEELRRILASTAGELMTAPARTVRLGSDAGDAAAELFEQKITALPVVDDAGRLVGLLSQYEFLKLIAEEPAPAE